jgi:hypothetical protein
LERVPQSSKPKKPNITTEAHRSGATTKSAADVRRWEQIAELRIGSSVHRVIGSSEKRRRSDENLREKTRFEITSYYGEKLLG